jgi:hypothetical protein
MLTVRSRFPILELPTTPLTSTTKLSSLPLSTDTRQKKLVKNEDKT